MPKDLVKGDCAAAARCQSVNEKKNGCNEVNVVQWLGFSEALDERLGLSVDDEMRGLMFKDVVKSVADAH